MNGDVQVRFREKLRVQFPRLTRLADTESGAEASATIYTVLQTAKANGREPAAYLAMLIERLPYCNELADFEALLPYTPGQLKSATN